MPTITLYSHWADRLEYADATGRVEPTWTGDIPVEDLAAIYRLFNRVTADDHARLRELGYCPPSLSVGDVIVLGSDTPSPSHHLVAATGFCSISAEEYAAVRASADPFGAAEQLTLSA